MPQWIVANSMPVETSRSFGLMGILNLTPDSFYDGGRHCHPGKAVEHARRLLAEGADIVDIGAASSRPGAAPVDPFEERNRLYPVLEACKKNFPGAIFSVDCWRADIAAGSLSRGAHIINDISGCNWDANLIETLQEFKPGYVLMHGNPRHEELHQKNAQLDILAHIKKFFSAKLTYLVRNGLPEDRIVLDPGIGFGKTREQNLLVLQNIEEFLEFHRPLLLGLSMKSIFQVVEGIPLAKRTIPTAVASLLAWQKGVFWHRVHHPQAVGLALRTACAFS